MPLDVPTLFVVSIFVTTILGLFLLFAWVQDRSIRALAWWGAAYLIGGISVAIYTMQDSLSNALSMAVGNALLFLACGVIWSGARLFHGREVRPLWMFAGAIGWLIGLIMPGMAMSSGGRIVLSSVAISAYTLLTAMELWGGRKERLLSRWPAVAVLVLQGIVFLTPVYIWEIAQGRTFALTLPNLASIGYVGLFASVVAYICYNRGVELVGANRAGAFFHLVPLMGTVLAILLLGEELHLFHIVAFVLIIAGVTLATRYGRSE